MKKIRVWDLPLRLFHWALATLVITAILAVKLGDAMELHLIAGSSALALVAFRIVWGLVGPRYARFASFAQSPAAIVGYLRGGKGKRERRPGHNPLGSLSVFALLAIVLAQASSGLFSREDDFEGPLAKFVGAEVSDRISWLHTEIGATLIYILIGLHLAAIAFYYFRRKQDLVRPMISGDQEVDVEAVPANDSWAVRAGAGVLLAACAAGVYYLVTL